MKAGQDDVVKCETDLGTADFAPGARRITFQPPES